MKFTPNPEAPTGGGSDPDDPGPPGAWINRPVFCVRAVLERLTGDTSPLNNGLIWHEFVEQHDHGMVPEVQLSGLQLTGQNDKRLVIGFSSRRAADECQLTVEGANVSLELQDVQDDLAIYKADAAASGPVVIQLNHASQHLGNGWVFVAFEI